MFEHNNQRWESCQMAREKGRQEGLFIWKIIIKKREMYVDIQYLDPPDVRGYEAQLIVSTNVGA